MNSLVNDRGIIVSIFVRYIKSLEQMDDLVKIQAWKASLLEELSSFLHENNPLYSHLKANYPYTADKNPSSYNENKKEEYKKILNAVVKSITE